MDVPGYALVTGAASGIGRACAAAFVSDGAAVIALLDIDDSVLLSVKAELDVTSAKHQRKQCQIATFKANVANEQQVNHVFDEVIQQFERIDYVVNAAGIAMKHQGGATFAETQDWQRIVDISLTGSFFILCAAAKIMLQQDPVLSAIDGRPLQRDSIVNSASIQGLVGVPISTAYTATKHAVIRLTRTAS